MELLLGLEIVALLTACWVISERFCFGGRD